QQREGRSRSESGGPAREGTRRAALVAATISICRRGNVTARRSAMMNFPRAIRAPVVEAPPMKANNILETIGNTPHVRINRLFGDSHHVWIKQERANPGGSIKDRIGFAMIEDAEKRGTLKKGGVIIEPTSGNTGIGLAMAAAVKGYKLILVMPESMSLERRRLMLAYGASFDLTPREKGMNGAIARGKELAATIPNSWIPQQFDNPANVDIHRRTTAQEILADFPQGLDYIITGFSTWATAKFPKQGIRRRARRLAGAVGRQARPA